MIEQEQEATPASSVVEPSKPRLLQVLGPGLITGASDDDPSGIATYSQAGARFGYALGWTLLLTFPLMTAVQMISARVGRTTGRGLAGVLRQHYSNTALLGIVVLLALANIINIGADLGAMADSAQLLLGGPPKLWLVFFTAFSAGLQVFMKYRRYVAVLKWLSLVLAIYLLALFIVHVDWGAAIKGLLVPSYIADRNYLTTIVAVLGTTISPYLFFWQSSQEAEDVRTMPKRQILKRAPEQGDDALVRIELDTIIGMAVSNGIALAIMLLTAATLHNSGPRDIETSAQAAQALQPVAGHFAEFIFAAGVIGTGLLAIPVLAGSAAYALGEAFRWPIGLARHPLEARAFYGTIVAATGLGLIVNFTPLNPISALFWSAVINGVVAVPVMIMMMVAASSTRVMGPFAIAGSLRWLGWLATAAMACAVIGMLADVMSG